jgi:Transposase/Transposase IS116/IS110/IS902 family
MTPPAHDAFAAFMGIDWADAKHDLCLPAPGTAKLECFQLEHTPEAIDAWVTTLRTRCNGPPVAVCLALDTGPMVSAWRKYDFLVLFPLNPLTLARSRDAFTPSRATDDPTAAALQLALLLTHRDKLTPLTPQRPTMRALAHLVEHRRRGVGDTVRSTHRLTRTLKHYFPHVLQWVQENETVIFCDFLRRWPTLKAVQLARRSTRALFFRDQHVRSPEGIARRIPALRAALPLPTADGVLAPHALLVQARVAQLRVTVPASADCAAALAQRAQRPPDFPLFQALPGAGPVFASRLLVAFGEHRARYTSAPALQKYAGIAPVPARSGKKSWVHWRLQGPKFLRQPVVEWAAESIRHAFWAQGYSQQQRDQGNTHQAAVRALAFKGIRLLSRGWQARTPYDAAVSLPALKRRGSSRMQQLAQASCTIARGCLSSGPESGMPLPVRVFAP